MVPWRPVLRYIGLQRLAQMLRQLFPGHAADVDAVHPFQLVHVENGGRLADALQGKVPYQVFTGEHLRLVVQRPAKEDKEVDHGVR